MLNKFRFFFIIFVVVALFFPGFAKLQELSSKLKETEEKIRETQKRNAYLEEQISRLKTNPEYLEMVARDRMGVVKKGETLLKLVPEGAEIPVETNTSATNTTNR